MATLERRVQVLFSPSQYNALQALAAAEHRPVAAVIREAVAQRLRAVQRSRQEALDAILARADAEPVPVESDWAQVKADIEAERWGHSS